MYVGAVMEYCYLFVYMYFVYHCHPYISDFYEIFVITCLCSFMKPVHIMLHRLVAYGSYVYS